MLEELTEYKNIHGNHDKLGNWTKKRRADYKNNKLSEEQITTLQVMGFSWDPYAAAWNEMAGELKAYKSLKGDCNVPRNCGKLGNWVAHQRRAKTNTKLLEERIKILKVMGFLYIKLKVVVIESKRFLVLFLQNSLLSLLRTRHFHVEWINLRFIFHDFR